MTLIVGLGNPGKKYIKTRHNIGFEAITLFAKKENFPSFKFKNKFNGEMSKKEEILLLKPETYMNKSGISVSSVANYYEIAPEKIVIIHDDADISLGKVKIDISRSSGGHKGVESIINQLSTKDFWRIRVGIGKKNNQKAGDIALKRFSKEERTLANEVLKNVVENIKKSLQEGFERKSFKKKSFKEKN